jgi:hypothetical protein
MKPYLLAIPLATLLLSTLGCSKQDEPAASATGSYKLDNTTITCQATATTSTTTSGLSVDYLLIDLVTTPQPATGIETLRLYFLKPNAASNNTYTLSDITLTNKGNLQPDFFSVNAATLTPTSSGGFSGTFSGKFINSNGSTPAPYTTITNGTFTNVRP